MASITWWLIAGVVLLIAELFLPGIFLLWFGIAALLTAGFVALVSTNTTAILLFFAIAAILSCVVGLMWYKRYKVDNTPAVAKQLYDKVGVITEVVSSGNGRASFGDSTWRVVGKNLSVGQKVKVTNIDGITLHVVLAEDE